jgi:hypothetical protein
MHHSDLVQHPASGEAEAVGGMSACQCELPASQWLQLQQEGAITVHVLVTSTDSQYAQTAAEGSWSGVCGTHAMPKRIANTRGCEQLHELGHQGRQDGKQSSPPKQSLEDIGKLGARHQIETAPAALQQRTYEQTT